MVSLRRSRQARERWSETLFQRLPASPERKSSQSRGVQLLEEQRYQDRLIVAWLGWRESASTWITFIIESRLRLSAARFHSKN